MALCLALSFSNYSNSQDISATGNLVSQTAWDGCATYLQSRIWGGYSGGPCPNVGLNGTGINFSYGQNTLSQTIAINRALADTGVQVNGYNYSWAVKNSNINGQQPGSYDPIALINVQFKDTKGSVVVNDTYNYGYHLPSWQTFSGTQTFSNPYIANTLQSVSLGVTSKDSGYWAGYYGPEFTNFRLSLNYSAAPVVTPPTVPKVVAASYTAVASASSISVDTSAAPSTAVNVGGVQLSTSGDIAVPDNIPQVLKDVVATVASTPVVAAVSAATTDAAKLESNKSGPSATVMNAVKQIQAADKAVQARAVQNANQQIATSSSRAQEQAMAIADTMTATSSASSQSSSQASAQSGTISVMQAPQQASAQSSQSSSQASFQTAMIAPQITQQVIQSSMQSQASVETTSGQQTGPISIPGLSLKSPIMFNIVNQDASGQNDFSLSAQPLAVSRSAIINEPIDFKMLLESSISETRTDTVNRNVQINDLAGGVDITAMATQPKGYEVYSMLTIKDAGFYAPKDIYGNQTNVDNARALRQLGSDRLHQEMVDQQFRR